MNDVEIDALSAVFSLHFHGFVSFCLVANSQEIFDVLPWSKKLKNKECK